MSTAAPGLSQLELGHQAPSTTRYPTCPQAELQLPRFLERPGYWLSTGEPLHNQPALTKRDASGPVLSTRKPTASGSTLAQKQDSEEEARSADADAEDRTGNSKYWLEKAAEFGGRGATR